MNAVEAIQNLTKALEAGGYNAAPSTLVQGAALQVENLSPVMQVVTFEDKHIFLQKEVGSVSCKSTLAQFDRQLSYGQFGGSAQLEGQVGQYETSDFVRVVVPMAFYSHLRRVTLVANMVDTVDGQKAEEREAKAAAKKISADIEFDLFRGKDDFSNAGTFDANPLMTPGLPNMLGLTAQIRQSDIQRNAKDLMFGEYGSDDTVVVDVGGTLTQDKIEDSSVRSAMNMGDADKLYLDPKTLSAYNKITYGKEMIILAGAPQAATGADLKKQWVSGGTVDLKASRFLSGKTRPAEARSNGPLAPASITCTSTTDANNVTAFETGEVYTYYATSFNEVGESLACSAVAETIVADGDTVVVEITHPASGTVRGFNVYRSAAGGSAASAKFIGRVILTAGASTTVFTDAGNKAPGFVTGVLVQHDTMEQKELAPYSRLKMAVTDLSLPEAHFRFTTLAVHQPRKNVLLDNIVG